MSIYTNNSSSPSTKYLHYDSLNSVDTITNNLGVVESRAAYKPFGEKLDLDKYGKATTKASHTNRGYTGHEHIEETKFINMNARLYDPTIARFMSADSIIPFMYDTQAFNRYSYVKNNPLKYTDPSGHSWWTKAKKWVKKNWKTIVITIVAIAVSFATFGAGMALVGVLGVTNATLGAVIVGATMGAAGGFAAGVVGTKLYGGSWSDAFKNGLKGALAGAIMGGISGGFGSTWNVGRVMAQSMGGGVSSEIMGGDFADGFKMAFITSAAAYAYSAVSSKYNTNGGKSHVLKNKANNVGRELDKQTLLKISQGKFDIPFTSDQSLFMRGVGELPFFDAFGEFHDGLMDMYNKMTKGSPLLHNVYIHDAVNIGSMFPSYPLSVLAHEQSTMIYLLNKNIVRQD